jgi:hypothetical protein
MSGNPTQIYVFEARETTVRVASVRARNVTEARELLNRWSSGNAGHLANMGGDAPIQLGDIESVKMTFRSLGCLERAASGTPTRSAETEGLSPKDGGPAPQGDAHRRDR